MRAILLVCLLTFVLGCGDREPQQPARLVEEMTAEQLIASVRGKYRDAQSYMDNAEYHERFAIKGKPEFYQAPPHTVSVVMARPNKFRVSRMVPQTDTPGLEVSTLCDGKVQRSFISDLQPTILEQPAPEVLSAATLATDPLLQKALLPVPLSNLFPQLDLLTAKQGTADALSGTEYAFLGDLPLESGPCYRVRIVTSEGPRVAWIDQTTRLLRRLELPSEAARKFRDPGGSFSKYELWIDFVDASTDVTMQDEVFTMQVPEGAKVVDKFPAPPAASQ